MAASWRRKWRMYLGAAAICIIKSVSMAAKRNHGIGINSVTKGGAFARNNA